MKKEGVLKRFDPTQTRAWNKLKDHFQNMKSVHMKSLFESDPDRFERFHLETKNLLLDFSKNRINTTTMKMLMALAQEVELKDGIEKMFHGAKINETENRAVLHTALRNPQDFTVEVDGVDVMPNVYRVHMQMKDFVDTLENGTWKGYRGHRITDVVNIGIGGSDLGVVMVAEALRPYWREGIDMHFVSNVDASHITETLKKLNPETTLFIIASKSFTTIETMTNAQTARSWFLKFGGEADIKHHFVAVSTNTSLVAQFGIDTQNMFEFWDWVGGRFSLSSAVGLSIMTALGYPAFRELLDGMHQMDQHFYTQPFEQNMPVILGLLGIWYNNFFEADSEAVLPYDQYLQHFPAYLQQASMESNGKSVNRNRETISYQTGTIIWGAPGTNGQHSFYQLIHQGSKLIPCDFILPVNPHHKHKNHHNILIANGLAQSEALMMGKTLNEVEDELDAQGITTDVKNQLAPFKVFDGNHPSNTILINKITPFSLGQLIALYEHKIFVQGYIWNIFSFDQWGVQLGKVLADRILPELKGEPEPGLHDGSTNALIQLYKNWQESK